MTEPKPITFEAGYRRLQEIAEEVNQAEVPVDRMADLFAEGKGLDRALTDHLAEQRTRIERIERGDEIQAFQIVPSSGDPASTSVARTDATDSAAAASAAPAASTEDDDIPF